MDMQDPIIKKIVRGRVKMLMNSNMVFFGTLAMRLIPKEIKPEFCKRMGTDGKHLYFNREYVEALTEEELKHMLAHCVLHLCYDHLGRRGRRKAKEYSEATDHVVNIELKDHHVGTMVDREINGEYIKPCCDDKYRDKSSDEVYELIIDDDGDGDGQGGQGDGEGQPSQGKGQGQPSDGKGQGDGSYDDHFDPNHTYPEDSGIENLSESERDLLRDELKQATMQAAKAAGAGRVPGGIMRLLEDLLDPKMDWREHLRLTVTSLLTSDYTYVRPNRRSSSMGGIILPGHEPDKKIKVACAIDTSGSISDEMIKEFMSEIKGIMEQFRDYELTVWCFDTQTYTIWTFTQDNVEDIWDFRVEGGGGTCFLCNWEMMKKNDMRPETCIIFSDGYPSGSWGDEDYQKELIYLLSGTKDIVSPIGRTLYYD